MHIDFRPGPDRLGTIDGHTGEDIKVGPSPGGGYAYRIGKYLSRDTYVNSASALADARRPQIITWKMRLTPDTRQQQVPARGELSFAT